MKNLSLNQAIQKWRTSPQYESSGVNTDKFLNIVLRQYLIPQINQSYSTMTVEQVDQYISTQSVLVLKDAMTIFDLVLDIKVKEGKVKSRTGNNYRCTLKKFLDWLNQQPWWLGLSLENSVKVTPLQPKLPPQPTQKKGKQVRISLKLDELPAYSLAQLEDYRRFRVEGLPPDNLNSKHPMGKDDFNCLRGLPLGDLYVTNTPKNYSFPSSRKPKLECIDVSTYKREKEDILYFWGYCQQYHPTKNLHLDLILDLDLLDEFVYWAIDHRGVTHSTGVNMAKTAIAVCKFKNYHRTQRRNWSDIEELVELKNLRNEYYEEYQREKKQLEPQKWANKELTHDQARQVVDYLYASCAPRRSQKNRTTGERTFSYGRDISAVARDVQTHLLVKLLVYTPVRQEEIRYLVYGESLIRKVDAEGNGYYEVYLEKHKLDYTGEPRHYRLPKITTADLDHWIFHWCPILREAVENIAQWQKFWGYSPLKTERLEERIKKAKQGEIPPQTKKTTSEYIKEQERLLKAANRRLDAFSIVGANLQNHNFIFMMFGKHVTEAFGKPLDVTTTWIVVRRAIAKATFALFGEAKWTNPHALRHIAEKHLRLIGKGYLADSFGALIGHSAKVGAEYAAQITTELEQTQNIVDNWWLE
ncbi:hypothetical protein [Geminocystis sp.]|uniref:hypothetical protein n=1 Tax=Geminocystis sp. TaxID=2664100 RepID=UPI0035946261